MKAVYYKGDNGEEVVETDIPEHLLAEAQRRRNNMIEKLYANHDDNIAEKILIRRTYK